MLRPLKKWFHVGSCRERFGCYRHCNKWKKAKDDTFIREKDIFMWKWINSRTVEKKMDTVSTLTHMVSDQDTLFCLLTCTMIHPPPSVWVSQRTYLFTRESKITYGSGLFPMFLTHSVGWEKTRLWFL